MSANSRASSSNPSVSPPRRRSNSGGTGGTSSRQHSLSVNSSREQSVDVGGGSGGNRRQDSMDVLAQKAMSASGGAGPAGMNEAVHLPRPNSQTQLPTYKVLLIGDAGVGKSNLLSRFASNKFDLTTRSTIGVEFLSREIDVGNDQRVNVQLWDTAGQERCGAISSAFFRNAKGMIVCYDTTRKNTLLNVPRWVAHAKQFVDENCQFVVVGNKLDLNNMREVTEEEAEEISHILSIRHYYASALTGDGVPTAFLQLILSAHATAMTQSVASPVVPTHGGANAATARPGQQTGRGVVVGGRNGVKRNQDMDTKGYGNPNFPQEKNDNKKKKCCN